jgi:hypothetical protein
MKKILLAILIFAGSVSASAQNEITKLKQEINANKR